MTNFTTVGLPRPVVTPELDFEAIRLLRMTDFVEQMREAGIVYDVDKLAGTPVGMAIRTAARGDLYYLQRLNDMARAVILPSFATFGDLDLQAVRAGIERVAGESDEMLRERIRLAFKAKSAAGPDDTYRSRARNTAPLRVRDVAVTAVTRNSSERVIRLAVLTFDNGGVATPDLLALLTASLNDRTFRQRSVTVEVVPAVIRVQPVAATVWLYPGVAKPTPEAGSKPLRDAFAGDQRLGFDLTRSYVEKHLHIAGAQRVELDGWSDAIAAFDEAIALGPVDVDYEPLTS